MVPPIGKISAAGQDSCPEHEVIVERFEAAWQRGERPTLDEFLPSDGHRPSPLLIELVHAELELRLKAGEMVRVEDYLRRFPELADDRLVVVDLIRAEYEQRQRREPNLTPGELHRRFPHLRDSLRLRRSPGPAVRTVVSEAERTQSAAGVVPGADEAERASSPLPDVEGYELLGELGRGGMGVVYKARQRSLDRVVALKMILHAGYADTETAARFRTEAEALAQVNHPNIVQIYEVGQQDGRPYFALELVDGGSLGQRLEAGPLRPREAAALTETLARAVQAAHDRNVVHRDLKPANVLLSRIEAQSDPQSGVPKIADFGLAKRVAVRGGLTESGAVMGTPAYMAPEQAAGKSKEVGPAADTYALGAILYELLTGRPPFRGPTPLDTLVQVVTEEPVPPRVLQPGTPRDLDTICLKCLRKDPRARYDSAADLADDLRRFLDGRPIQARPTSAPERLVRWVRRRPALAGLYAVVTCTLLAFAGAGWWYYRDSLQRNAELQTQKGAALQARNDAVKEKDRAQRALYAARMKEVGRVWADQNLRTLRELLAQLIPKGEEQDYRDFEWHFLSRSSARHLRICDVDSVGEGSFLRSALAVSTDGTRLFTSYTNGDLKTWDMTSGKLLTTLSAGKSAALPEGMKFTDPSGRPAFPEGMRLVRGLAISPDASRYAFVRLDPKGEVRSVADGKVLLTLQDCSPENAAYMYFSGLSFSPDGRRIAYLAHNLFLGPEAGLLKVVDLETGKNISPVPIRGAFRTPVFSPDGKRIAAGSVNGNREHVDVKVWDVTTGTCQHTLRGKPNGVTTALAFSPDGNRLAVGTGTLDPPNIEKVAGEIHLYDLPPSPRETNVTEPRTVCRGHTGAILSLAFAPDGRRLVSGSGDKTVRIWDGETGREQVTFHAHNNVAACVLWRADGKILSLGQEATVKVWDSAALANPLPVWRADSPLACAAFSADGDRVLAVREDRQVRAFDVRTGAEVLRHQVKASAPLAPDGAAVSPDLRLLAYRTTERELCLYDLPSGTRLSTLVARDDFTRCNLAFSPDGALLAAGRANAERGTVAVWETATGHLLFEAAGGGMGIAFSPDGKRVASYFARNNGFGQELGALRAWDARSGEEVFHFRGGLWNAVHSDISPAIFSPNGECLVASSTEGNLRFWSLGQRKQVLELRGHLGQAAQLSFRADGRRLVSAGRSDGTLRFWDPASGLEVGLLSVGAEGISRVVVAPNGRRLLTGGQDGRLLSVWDGSPRDGPDEVPPR